MRTVPVARVHATATRAGTDWLISPFSPRKTPCCRPASGN